MCVEGFLSNAAWYVKCSCDGYTNGALQIFGIKFLTGPVNVLLSFWTEELVAILYTSFNPPKVLKAWEQHSYAAFYCNYSRALLVIASHPQRWAFIDANRFLEHRWFWNFRSDSLPNITLRFFFVSGWASMIGCSQWTYQAVKCLFFSRHSPENKKNSSSKQFSAR